MKVKRILHGVLLVLGLSVIGLQFSYLMWLITDEEFRETGMALYIGHDIA